MLIPAEARSFVLRPSITIIMAKTDIVEFLENAPVVPVFYNGDSAVASEVLHACYNGGIRAFEFANRGPAAADVFKSLIPSASAMPGLKLGVGSISSPKDAIRFIRMGAAFVVGPQYVPGVMWVCRLFGVPYIPGCGTVSEAGNAQRHGCAVYKVFPGEVLGPEFIRALLAPMPWSKLLVTGGEKPDRKNLEAWFEAGAT